MIQHGMKPALSNPSVPVAGPMPETHQLLTYSRQDAFKTCRRREFYAYEIGIRSSVDAKALRIGTAGHEALDILKRGETLDDAIAAVRRGYTDMPDQYEPLAWSYERETVERLICGYAWRWSNSRLEYLATERTFSVPLTNPATGRPSTVFALAGRIDGIVRLEDGRAAVMEHKFLSDSISSDSDLWKRLRLDQQISLYVLAARQLGYDVESVLYDVIRKPLLQPGNTPILDQDGLKIVLDASGNRVLTKQGKPRQTSDSALGYVLQEEPTSPYAYGERIAEDMAARPDWYYVRAEIPRLQQELDECASELWEIQKTIRECQRTDRWYRTVNRHTCSWCPYFELCSTGYDPSGELPRGFFRVDNVHPELET